MVREAKGENGFHFDVCAESGCLFPPALCGFAGKAMPTVFPDAGPAWIHGISNALESYVGFPPFACGRVQLLTKRLPHLDQLGSHTERRQAVYQNIHRVLGHIAAEMRRLTAEIVPGQDFSSIVSHDLFPLSDSDDCLSCHAVSPALTAP